MASAVAEADIPRGAVCARYSPRDGGNIFRGYDCAPLGCSDTIRVLHLEMGGGGWSARTVEQPIGRNGRERQDSYRHTGPVVGTGQNADSCVWVLLAGSILCCSGHHLESGCKR